MFVALLSSSLGAQVLKFGLSTAPISLDPRFATDAESSRVNRLLYRRLVDFDVHSQVVADLATWEQLSPVHYRFRLCDCPQKRRFHNGDFLDSADVLASYAFVLDEANASPHRGSLEVLAGIEAVDKDTVDFFLHKSDWLFPSRLVLGIVPKTLIERGLSLARDPVGSGAFRFVGWDEGGKLSLVRHDGLRVDFVPVKDPTVRVLKLLRGELDLIQNNLSAELIRWLEKQDQLSLQHEAGQNFMYLGFNLADDKTGDVRVRQAVAYAINRADIIRYILGGAAQSAEALLPPQHWAGNPELLAYGFDPDKARALLREAGFSADKPLVLSYKSSNNPLSLRHAAVIQHQLGQVGIVVNIRSYDWGTFYADIKAGQFQLFSLSWVGVRNPDIFRYVFHSEAIPPKGANRGRFVDAVTDGLIEAAEAAGDMPKRAALYRDLQAHLWQQLPYVPLWYPDNVAVSRRGVRGYGLSISGDYDGLLSVTMLGL